MPRKLRSSAAPRRRRAMRKRNPLGRTRLRRIFNPAPVFTETYALTSLQPSSGGILKFSMDQVPQLAQYTALYQKYRILRASVMLLPEFTSYDQNQAENNAALSRSTFGLTRIAWAVNDSPNITAPATELDVLKDNGARIRPLTDRGVRFSCRPVPNVEDSNGVEMTFKRKYINFEATGPNAVHSGISWWISQLSNGTPATTNVTVCYVKLTFQLSDPR